MRIVADTSRCVGAGQCVLTDPATFDQNDDDGTVLILRERPEDEQTSQLLREAVHVCPSRALSIVD
ncbi:ferredoxin [Dactylosporangium sp. CA-092794]|uniref:ferredoxin n=1 Tax=Dactylosporangium sp. CA-092794 TaxID=3239929 RepID=UPI003D8C5FFD